MNAFTIALCKGYALTDRINHYLIHGAYVAKATLYDQL